jgi:hypothetical protein
MNKTTTNKQKTNNKINKKNKQKQVSVGSNAQHMP